MTHQTSLANRYGTPKQKMPQRTKFILGAAALAVAVIVAAVMAIVTGSKPVSAQDVGFSIIDAGHATVDFEVTKDPAATAECAIQVLAENYAVVGWKVATIGPNSESEGAAGGRTTAHRVALRTESLGTSGGVNACWIIDDGR